MTRLFLVLALAGLAGAAAASSLAVADESNICNLAYYYCPRDPGCVTYDLSVTNVSVWDYNTTKAIPAADIKVGSLLRIDVTGTTEIPKVPVAATWRIYDMAGHNAATGLLSDVLHLDGKGGFFMSIDHFAFPAASLANGMVEFGIDVFMDKSADEGMCVEIANKKYIAMEEAKVDPPFVDYCVDEGHGTFKKETIKIVPTPIESPGCGPPPPARCQLDWYYCPRDPGCVTYDMSVGTVEVDVQDPTALRAGDNVTLLVKGTTTMSKVPVEATWRIYDMAGHNAATGVLSDVCTLDTSKSPTAFRLDIPFTFPAASISGSLLEFGLDIFMDKSADEGMCVEVANPAYVAAMKAKVSPPFVDYCVDEGGGRFVKKTIPIVPKPAVCLLENKTMTATREMW